MDNQRDETLPGHAAMPAVDLGPLSWVVDTLRDTLHQVDEQLKQFSSEVAAASGSHVTMLDTSALRQAAQGLHEVVGVLGMVERPAAARLAAAMESAVERFVSSPELCTGDAVGQLRQGGVSLVDYLSSVLRGNPDLAPGLFPVYQPVAEMAQFDRIHPADLWDHEWKWIETTAIPSAAPELPADQLQAAFFNAALLVFKTDAAEGVPRLSELGMQLAQSATAKKTRVFWQLFAAFAQALAAAGMPFDVHAKRLLSRVVSQFTVLQSGQGGGAISERLAHDLLFFVVMGASKVPDHHLAPLAHAVVKSHGLEGAPITGYHHLRYGVLDQAQAERAKQHIATFKELWSDVAAGDVRKAERLHKACELMRDALQPLWPDNGGLLDTIQHTADAVAQSGHPPSPDVGMEMATTTLFLEASLDDYQPSSQKFADRAQQLASRLQSVQAGQPVQPLTVWMRTLYMRMSDSDTMRHVVLESRAALGDIEQRLDRFFREPQSLAAAQETLPKLDKMSGALSLLGYDDASKAVKVMQSQVEQLIAAAPATGAWHDQHSKALIEDVGDSLGTLSFLLEMLGYQPEQAAQQFYFDEALQKLRQRIPEKTSPIAQDDDAPGSGETTGGATSASEQDALAHLDHMAIQADLADQQALARQVRAAAAGVQAAQGDQTRIAQALDSVKPAQVAAPAPQLADDGIVDAMLDEEDLRDIFLEEAAEVIGNGQAAVQALQVEPSSSTQLTNLRRAFHTLKGSGRMVGLASFGEAAWEMERVLNGWLAENAPASPALLSLAADALKALAQWRDAIAQQQQTVWNHQDFKRSAAAMQADKTYLALQAGGGAAAAEQRAGIQPHQVEVEAVLSTAGAEKVPAAQPPEPHGDAVAAGGLAEDASDAAPDAQMLFVQEPQDKAAEQEAPIPGQAAEAVHHAQETDPAPDLRLDEKTEEEPLPPADDSHAEADIGLPQPLHDSAAHSAVDKPGGALQPDDMWSEISALDSATTALFHPDEPAQQAASAMARDDEVPPAPAACTGAALASILIDTQPQRAVLDDMVQDLPEDQIKLIGDLRIPIPLFSAYLNEADAWSRQLVTQIEEWRLEQHAFPPESASHLAHSLAGSSATVGLAGVASLSRGLEHAIDHLQQRQPLAHEAQVLTDAAELIRHNLHQFAAGMAQPMPMPMLEQLAAIIEGKAENAPPASVTAEPDQPAAEAAAGQAEEALLASGVNGGEPPAGKAPPVLDKVAGELKWKLDAAAAHPQSAGAFARPHITTSTAPMQLQVQQAPASSAPSAAVSPTASDVSSIAGASSASAHAQVKDAIDPELFDIFRAEADELIPQLSSAMRQWMARPDNQGARSEIMRLLHTLKGSARLAGAMRLGAMAHDIETNIGELGVGAHLPATLEPIQTAIDDMEREYARVSQMDQVGTPDQDTPDAPVAGFAQASGVAPASAAVENPAGMAAGHMVVDAASAQPRADDASAEGASSAAAAAVPSQEVAMPVSTNLAAQKAALQQQVRVRAQLLDRMLGQAGEVMTSRARLEGELGDLRTALKDMDGSLERLRAQLRDMELQAETQMQSRMALSKEQNQNFDPLEFDRFTRVQELTRMMAESVNDVASVQRNLLRTVQSTEDDLSAQARQTKELQSDLLRTRMVEFDSLSERLYRVVRQAAKESDKQVKLDITGANIEMDRSVIERVAPAFEHLLRNAVVHGVESAEQRARVGKGAVGSIQIDLHHEGNDVVIKLRDDGAGLDVLRIREKAVAKGLLAAEDNRITDEQAGQLIFSSGLSTVDTVTSLAGRGVGMDVVRSEVNALGGRIEVASRQHLGTEFTLVLPLTTAVTQVVELRMGDYRFGVPSSLIETVLRASAKDIQTAYNNHSFKVGNEDLPFYWGGAIVQVSRRSEGMSAKRQVVVVLRSAAQRLVLHVDEVVGTHEVVVKNIGPQLVRMPGLAGITVLPDGRLLYIYNPVALSFVYEERIRAFGADLADPSVLGGQAHGSEAAPQSPVKPLVLVVDDSITVRRVTERLLKREGYRVALASDGMAALRQLGVEKPAVVLSDIEMPQMDGFDLLRNIRADDKLRDLPVIMITSRTAEKHHAHAMELGANGFLGKPYPEEQLLEMVATFSAPATESVPKG